MIIFSWRVISDEISLLLMLIKKRKSEIQQNKKKHKWNFSSMRHDILPAEMDGMLGALLIKLLLFFNVLARYLTR